jgi:hypothetical protein
MERVFIVTVETEEPTRLYTQDFANAIYEQVKVWSGKPECVYVVERDNEDNDAYAYDRVGAIPPKF